MKSAWHLPCLALPADTGGEIDFLEQGQLAYESLRFGDRVSPAFGRAVDPWTGIEGRAVGIVQFTGRCPVGAGGRCGVLCLQSA